MKVEDNKIYHYIENGNLQIEKIIADYSNYINTIIRNSYINLSCEDTEEVVLDVFLTIWKNQEKLDISKSMSAYISGITKNLVKYKYRQYKGNQSIEEYDEKIAHIANQRISIDLDDGVKVNYEKFKDILAKIK